MINRDQDLSHLETVLRKAGDELNRYRAKSNLHVRHKSDESLVTEADLASEKCIIDYLTEIYPNDFILSEEGGWVEGNAKNGQRVWIIDPLDGTTNFANAYPFYCISIARALVDENVLHPELGGVYDPVRDKMYLASQGNGATCNGYPLAVRKDRPPEKAFLVTGFAYHKGPALEREIHKFLKVAERCQSIRRDGAAALDLALVAEGIYDGYWETGIKPWDVAAGALIVAEAGGVVHNIGRKGIPFNPEIDEIVCGSAGIVDFLENCLL